MNLVMETRLVEERDDTMIYGSLRNAGTEPVTILVEFQYHQSFAILKDDQGLDVKWSRHAGAVRGLHVMRNPAKVRVLQAGETEEIAYFRLTRGSRKDASSGDLHWSLKNLPSETITVELVYEVQPEWAAKAKQHGAPGVAVGRWTSAPVTLPLR